jgi:hypothetical protein
MEKTCIDYHVPSTLHQNPKLWAIALKMAIQHEKDEFFRQVLKTSPIVTSLWNRSGTPKLWEITHKNIHKTRKWQVFFWHGSETCTDCERAYKSLWILKTPGNRSPKMAIKHLNDKFLVKALKLHSLSQASEIALEHQNCARQLRKISIKLINDEFFWHGSKTRTNYERPCK